MEIIDAHAHIYPAKIAEKATQAIGKFYDIEMDITVGTTAALVEQGLRAGVSRFVVHSCATKTEQVKPINRYIKTEMEEYSQFIGFMTLHEDLTESEVEEEVDWAIKNGFKGIKLHPDFQRVNIDDERLNKIYSAAGDKLAVLLHTGDDRYDYSRPYKLAKVAKQFPKVNFIGAHFGGYRRWDEFDVYKGLENVYFDTSSSLEFISPKKATELIKKGGVEKFFFGTDFPMWDAEKELQRFDRLKIGDDAKEKILGLNIKKLLKL